MRHLAVYLMLAVGGNTQPTAEDISSVLSQAGIESDPERLTALLAELEGKDLNQVIALGKAKLMVGGAMAASSAPTAASSDAAAAPVAKAAEKPAEEEVDALDGGMDMFGGGGAKTGDY